MRGWLPTNDSRSPLALILAIVLLSQLACGGGNFASQLRTVLNLAPALIDSLVTAGVIKSEQRTTYVQDFEDLAEAAATLKEGLDGCTDNPCKLDAVDRFQVRFFDIERRGHFKVSPKLQNVETILKAIIATARAYYSTPKSTNAPAATIDREAQLKAQIEQLKAAMQP